MTNSFVCPCMDLVFYDLITQLGNQLCGKSLQKNVFDTVVNEI